MSDVRVRFAPSPTGYLHMGGARTALFNWLFARHEKGRFILRIEDTDAERSTDEFCEQLLAELSWLGLTWDEGPQKGGDYAPYRQSERIDIYADYAGRLVAGGHAYPCFCTDEELERKKSEKLGLGHPPHYDGECRSLDEEGRVLKRKAGHPESVRFTVPAAGEVRLDDLVRGEVVFPPGMVGDFVIMRSNGLPTYNFAAAVDDSLMRITHVIRGEEHLSNTLRQLLIYDALGASRPLFAHIPLIHGPDRTKLSKRHGAPNIGDFRRRGYVPEAIVNYLAFLGWSFPGSREIVTPDELVAEFTLERVSDSPSIFDEAKLNWVSAQHVRAGGPDRFFEQALPFFPAALTERYDRSDLQKIFTIVSENLPCFSRLEEETRAFVPGIPELDEDAEAALPGTAPLLERLAGEFADCGNWSKEEIGSAIKKTGKELGIKGKNLYMPLRAAVTGSLHGPDLADILLIRGRDDVTGALEAAAGARGA